MANGKLFTMLNRPINSLSFLKDPSCYGVPVIICDIFVVGHFLALIIDVK